ncbi:MAG: MotA/TolQ/ExbB proton channel family protein [Pseudomonadota bacterium]
MADEQGATPTAADAGQGVPAEAGAAVDAGNAVDGAAVGAEAVDGTVEAGAEAVTAAAPPDAASQAMTALADAAELAEVGGPVVAILGVMSVFALAIVIAKLIQFAAARVSDRRSAREALALYRAGRAGDAFARARDSKNPAARVLTLAMEGQARGLPEPNIREDCYAEAQTSVEALRGWMRPLEVIASLAPLLGLFGTVLGMIEAFSQLEAAGSQVDPAILSGGIWVALLTTAVGLAVAIPVVAAVNWFERRVERVEHDIDTGLASLFATGWPTDDALSTARNQAAERERSMDNGVHVFRTATAGE